MFRKIIQRFDAPQIILKFEWFYPTSKELIICPEKLIQCVFLFNLCMLLHAKWIPQFGLDLSQKRFWLMEFGITLEVEWFGLLCWLLIQIWFWLEIDQVIKCISSLKRVLQIDNSLMLLQFLSSSKYINSENKNVRLLERTAIANYQIGYIFATFQNVWLQYDISRRFYN